tara:strand:+ start:566 stop:772 length:207 start_codon:yes stop_codon:yes gene_type:complete
MPKFTIYIRDENLKKYRSIPNKAAWVNNILHNTGIKELKQEVLPDYVKLENKIKSLEKRMRKLEKVIK